MDILGTERFHLIHYYYLLLFLALTLIVATSKQFPELLETLMNYYNHFLSADSTILASKKISIIGEHVIIRSPWRQYDLLKVPLNLA